MSLQNYPDVVPVFGFPKYEIDQMGSVYSLHNWRKLGRRKIRTSLNTTGYVMVSLCLPGKRRTTRNIHRLVIESFTGEERPEGLQARHLNGNKLDNRLVNLCWGTPQENTNDKRVHGSIGIGESHSQAILTEQDVRSIRSMGNEGLNQGAIARQFGVSRSHVNKVIHGACWRNVEAANHNHQETRV